MSTQLSIADTAKVLNLSEQRVRTLCRSGELESEKIGKAWIIQEASVKRFGIQFSHTIAEDHPVYKTPGVKPLNKPIALSFFSGAMGLDLGIEKSGFDIRLACEVDKYCRQTIALNKPEVALLGDISHYTAADIRANAGLDQSDDIDLIMGGPPCQAFSTAGKRKAFADDRGNVFVNFIDLAIELQPKFIVIENVRGLLSCPLLHRPHNKRGAEFPELKMDELKGGAMNFILSRLKNSNYSYSFNLYSSANFGSPQVRERVIIVCSRDGDTPPHLVPTHSNNKQFGLPQWKSFKKAVSGIEEHHHLNFPEKRLYYYRMLKAGQNWRSLPLELQKEAMGKSYYAGGGKTGFLRRLAWEKPSPTLVTHPAMPATDLAHPEEDRPLSIEEYKRIQEFPDSWVLAGPLIQQYKQVGNAVPASLGFAVGNLIKKLLKNDIPAQYPGFKYSRYRNTDQLNWEMDFRKRYEADNKTQSCLL